MARFSETYTDTVRTDLLNYRELDNGSGTDLENGEVAIDTNRGGAGTVALVWKSQDGATTGYVDLTTGY